MKKFFTTSRLTGLLYLGLAITGVLAFLFAKEKIYLANDAMATTNNLITQSSLARFGIASELALVAFQALSAVWFFKLFHRKDLFASLSLTIFGSINAIIILIASAFWLNAFTLAQNSPDQFATVHLLFQLHETLWVVGKLFFGLWLIPMGYLAKKANMPKLLAWILILGGLGYILSLFLGFLPNLPSSLIENITIPATIGEFWIIGYLLFKKIKA